MVVRGEPEGLDGRDPGAGGARHVGDQLVSDVHRLRSLEPEAERPERCLEDPPVRLAGADLVGQHDRVDPLSDAELVDAPPRQPGRLGPAVRDDRQPQTALAQRFEQRVRRSEQHVRRRPGDVLRIEETIDPLVVETELAPEQVAVVVTQGERGQQVVSEARAERGGVRFPSEGGEPGPVAGRQELVVPGEVEERPAPVEENYAKHSPARLTPVARRILWSSLALAPVALAARYVAHADATTLFVLSALALVPLAWVIGEATDHAAEHTGAGVGGFLNASFGNAPELIIALFAVADGLPGVVRGSLTGSVVSNILLVLGAAMIAGGDGDVDTRSLRLQLLAVFGAVALLLIPSVPGWHGSADRHSLFLATIPVAVVLLAAYGVITVRNLRIHREEARGAPSAGTWSIRNALLLLAGATVITALISEILVHSLHDFGTSVGLNEFFIAAVIVAIVGNAAEHGGAVVIAHRGNTRLATEIAISSSMQVALFVAPAVALLSWLVGRGLPLSFRVVELATIAAAAAFSTMVIWDGRSRRWEGFLLVAVYGGVVVVYALA